MLACLLTATYIIHTVKESFNLYRRRSEQCVCPVVCCCPCHSAVQANKTVSSFNGKIPLNARVSLSGYHCNKIQCFESLTTGFWLCIFCNQRKPYFIERRLGFITQRCPHRHVKSSVLCWNINILSKKVLLQPWHPSQINWHLLTVQWNWLFLVFWPDFLLCGHTHDLKMSVHTESSRWKLWFFFLRRSAHSVINRGDGDSVTKDTCFFCLEQRLTEL